jgi:prephenate dehydratase
VTVSHCLLATEATDYREIRVVYSHPQALAQCRDFLMRNKLEPRPYYDTAGAAKMLARENPKAAAAIASALCGELYDLEIIKEGIEDGPSNSTRFLLLSRDTCIEKRDKTSIIFAVAHEAGQLYGVLQLFAQADINLTRIASMPLRSDPSNYSFFLDFEGSEDDAHVADVLQKMGQMTIALKNLGSYPAYQEEAY